jgi:hypothetical protein
VQEIESRRKEVEQAAGNREQEEGGRTGCRI